MPFKSSHVPENADRRLASLQPRSLEALRAIQVFIMISRTMARESRQLIDESRKLLADTQEIARGYQATDYTRPYEKRKAA
jgi:hypothetical protein